MNETSRNIDLDENKDNVEKLTVLLENLLRLEHTVTNNNSSSTSPFAYVYYGGIQDLSLVIKRLTTT